MKRILFIIVIICVILSCSIKCQAMDLGEKSKFNWDSLDVVMQKAVHRVYLKMCGEREKAMDIDRNQFVNMPEGTEPSKNLIEFSIGQVVVINNYKFEIESIDVDKNRLILKPRGRADNLLKSEIEKLKSQEKKIVQNDKNRISKQDMKSFVGKKYPK